MSLADEFEARRRKDGLFKPEVYVCKRDKMGRRGFPRALFLEEPACTPRAGEGTITSAGAQIVLPSRIIRFGVLE